MKYSVKDRETNNCTFAKNLTLKDAKEFIRLSEIEDKKVDMFTENYYEIIKS